MSLERRVVSVHIEKTAGTSVQDLLESALGKDRVLVYNPIDDTLARAADLKARRTSAVHDLLRAQIANTPLAFIINRAYLLLSTNILKPKTIHVFEMPDDFSAVHGHFVADRFDLHISDPVSVVVIRDPLERMRSQYAHWRRTRGVTQWRVRIPFRPSLTFEEYALLPELRNYQSQALGKKNLGDFAVVGITDELDVFADKLIECIRREGLMPVGCDRGFKAKRLNRTPDAREPIQGYGPAFISRFYDLHEKDYELYESAKKLA